MDAKTGATKTGQLTLGEKSYTFQIGRAHV